MFLRDINAACKAVTSIKAASITATETGEIVDMLGASSVMVIVPVGAVATADASHYFTFTFVTGTDAALGDAAAIASGSYMGAKDEDLNTWDRIINSTAEADTCYSFGVNIDKVGERWGRVLATETGTAEAIFGAIVVLCYNRHQPTSE